VNISVYTYISIPISNHRALPGRFQRQVDLERHLYKNRSTSTIGNPVFMALCLRKKSSTPTNQFETQQNSAFAQVDVERLMSINRSTTTLGQSNCQVGACVGDLIKTLLCPAPPHLVRGEPDLFATTFFPRALD